MAELMNEKSMNRMLARMGGVQSEVDSVARKVKSRAESNAAQHRDTGEYSGNFEVRKVFGGIDREVYNDHPAAQAVEYGHFAEKKDGSLGKFVPGQFNLTRAI